MAEKHRPRDTINSGGTGRNEDEEARDRSFGVDGNVKERGEDPSPDDRERGETSGADRATVEDSDR